MDFLKTYTFSMCVFNVYIPMCIFQFFSFAIEFISNVLSKTVILKHRFLYRLFTFQDFFWKVDRIQLTITYSHAAKILEKNGNLF